MTKSVELELDKIRIDGGTQPRAKIDMETVADYHAAFELGANFPPIDVFFDGKEYWLADGFHRWHGARAANMESLDAVVHKGTVRDAKLFSYGCNGSHGLKRTNEDKNHSVKSMLGDEEWSKWSDRAIAEKCGVTHPFVAKIRETLETVTGVSERKFTTSTGKTATIKVEPPKPKPESKPAPAPTQAQPAEQPESKWSQGASTLPDVQDHAPEDSDSDNLFHLKRYWKLATKKDRTAFLEWTKQ